eukprot:1041482-Pyramimonas_sp.AAC.1
MQLSHRLASARGALGKYKHVLCSRQFASVSRYRLFESAVTPTALCCSSAGTAWEDTNQA